MKIPKRLIGILILFFTLLIELSAQNSLIVKLNDGSVTGTLLSSLDRITFLNGNVILKNTDASTNSLVLSDINRMTFGILSEVPNVISDVNKIFVYPSPARNYILLKNVNGDKLNIQIISLDGVVMVNKQLIDINQPIDISNLVNGLYLLKVKNTTLKFTKQ